MAIGAEKFGTVVHSIHIRLHDQKLLLQKNGRTVAVFLISSSRFGVGEQEGSYQTPRGEHIIIEKFGEDAPLGTVFVGRIPTGKVFASEQDEDPILTRILRLKGCEVDKNLGGSVDSYKRYIYIHGTPDSAPMGEVGSIGCIRMRNEDIVTLYDQVSIGTRVRIDE